MKINLITFTFILGLSSIKCEGKINIIQKSIDTLSSFEATYFEGDNYITEYKIKVYKNEDSYFVKKISPIYYYGSKTENDWVTQLDPNHLDLCRDFVKKLISISDSFKSQQSYYKNVSVPVSSVREYLLIQIGKDSILFNGDDMGFKNLYDQLFDKHLKDLELNEQKEYERFMTLLKGKWFIQNKHLKIMKGDTVFLTRINNGNLTNRCIFGDSSFTNEAKEVLGPINFKRYRLILFEDNINESDNYMWKIPYLFRIIITKSSGEEFSNCIKLSTLTALSNEIILKVDEVW